MLLGLLAGYFSVLLSEAWFLDADTLWLRQPDCSNAVLGHLFASLSAAPGSAVRGSRVAIKHYWQIHFLTKPFEEVFLASPFRVPAKSPWLRDGISDLQCALFADANLEYLYFMKHAVTYQQLDTQIGLTIRYVQYVFLVFLSRSTYVSVVV